MSDNIDDRVAKEVMGWTLIKGRWSDGGDGLFWREYWSPSHSIGQAMMVVENMVEDDMSRHIDEAQSQLGFYAWPGGHKWHVRFDRWDHEVCGEATEKSLPLAICKAALAAVESK